VNNRFRRKLSKDSTEESAMAPFNGKLYIYNYRINNVHKITIPNYTPGVESPLLMTFLVPTVSVGMRTPISIGEIIAFTVK